MVGQKFVRLLVFSYVYYGYSLIWNQADPGLTAGTGTIWGAFPGSLNGFWLTTVQFNASQPAWANWTKGGHLSDINNIKFEDGTTGTVNRLREGVELTHRELKTLLENRIYVVDLGLCILSGVDQLQQCMLGLEHRGDAAPPDAAQVLVVAVSA